MICYRCGANKDNQGNAEMNLCDLCTGKLCQQMYDTFGFTGDLIWDLAIIQGELRPIDENDDSTYYHYLLFGKSEFVNVFGATGLLKIWGVCRATIAM
jgi:hypothetical protein